MFWRRRKLPEDDEPLVPHGLIWQATEGQDSAELPPDMWDNSPNEVKPSPADPVEMRVRVSAPVEAHFQLDQTAPDRGEHSPPAKWPRVDAAEIARRAQRVDTAVSFPFRKPPVGAAVPKALESAHEQEREPARLELVPLSPSTPLRAVRAERFKNFVSRYRRLMPSLSLMLERVRRAKVFSRINDSANRSVLKATQGLQLVRQRSGPALDGVRLRWVDASRAAVTKYRTGIQGVRESLRAVDGSGPTRIWHRARTLQVRIRIPASNWRFLASTSFAGSAKATAVRVRHSLQRDSRLWASVAMGGLSALLALGVISALRHYGSGKELLPPTRQTVDAATPSPTTQPPLQPVLSREATTQKPSPASAGRRANDAAARPATSEVQKSASATSSPASKHRARHKSAEEDYVAADTYVYYGVGGKPKR